MVRIRMRAVFLVLLGAGALPAQQSLPQTPGRVAVLPDSAVPHILTQCSRGAPTGVLGFWRPTPADVAVAEEAVDQALAHALDSLMSRDPAGYTEWRERPRATWPDQYYRQYVGLRYRDGRRTIYVNGFAVGWPSELSRRVAERDTTGSHPFAKADWWRFTVATVCDGGAMFFGAEYEPSSKRVLSFQFNGHA